MSAQSNQYRLQKARSIHASFADNPGVIASPPLLYGGTFLVGAMLHGLFPRPVLPLDVAAEMGFAVLLVGVTLAIWSRRTMERAGTNVNPARPATTLVVTGPYGFSRNPMYLSRTLLYVGLALLANALCIVALLVPLMFLIYLGVIKREERYLEAKFGDAYRQYRVRVRRWL